MLYRMLLDADARMIRGKQKWAYKLENIVDICENAISYEGSLVIGAIGEFVVLSGHENAAQISLSLQAFQKRLKYGLPTSMAIALYELGFSDRVVAIGLTALMDGIELERANIIQGLKFRQDQVLEYLRQYPSYFSEVFMNLTANIG